MPPALNQYCILTPQQIIEDGDEGAAEVYDFADEVEAFVTTPVARAIVDMNRAEDDRSKDGVVKTHTCWDVPVYDPFPPEAMVDRLLAEYHRPYHRKLSALAASPVRLGIDCHTMVAFGPPVAPDPGAERPWVCLSNGDGTCPDDWMESLRRSFEKQFEGNVRLNDPFRGGYITRIHAAEMPWVQLEISRAPFLANDEKRRRVIQALRDFSL